MNRRRVAVRQQTKISLPADVVRERIVQTESVLDNRLHVRRGISRDAQRDPGETHREQV